LEALSLGEDDRRKVVQGIVKESAEGGFAAGELAQPADISLAEELLVMCSLGLVMGGPLALCMGGFASMMFGTWRAKVAWLGLSSVLAFHPLPRCDDWLRKSRLTLAVYKYFSYRFCWSGNAKEEVEKCGAWIGVAPPHGVLPLANILSIAAVNTFAFTRFTGSAASVVLHTPFLRYLSLYGIMDVSGKSITTANSKGISVGVVPDGIAGIFRCSSSDEVVVLKKRKGLAKLALKTGHALVPAYSIGNTTVFSAWYDPWGVMESASRKLQAAVFPFWGRAYLPIPRRCNVTMLIGAPLVVTKVDNPTQEQVDELHDKLLAEFVRLFDTHKIALGWADKKIVFE